MIQFDPSVLASFTKIEIHDPSDLDADSRITRLLPKGDNANTYRLRNRRLFQTRPQGRLSLLSGRVLGDLKPCFNTDRFGTVIGIEGNGMPRYCLNLMLAGAMEMVSGAREPVTAQATNALIYRALPGTRFLTTDDNARMAFWVEASRLERALEARLDAPLRDTLCFAPNMDMTRGGGASLVRLLNHLFAELKDPDGFFTSPAALSAYTETIAQVMLDKLPHNYSDRLNRPASAAIPHHLRIAEEFIEAYADRPLTMAEIAAAAGCSVRGLQRAFRQFRGTVPLRALRDMRLERAHAALASAGENETPRDIARRFGFTNPSRFIAAYKRRFREHPSETRRDDGA